MSIFQITNIYFANLSSTLNSLTESHGDSASSIHIRDCRRLGKYQQGSHRPILATFGSTAEVDRVLSSSRSFPQSISIRPDLSPKNRKARFLLLKERRRLIDSGVDRLSIRIKDAGIYVDNKLSGKVSIDTLIFSQVHSYPSSNLNSSNSPLDSSVPSETSVTHSS